MRASEGRREFENLLFDLSRGLMNADADSLDREVENGLGEMLDFFQGDRCCLLEVPGEKSAFRVSHFKCVKGAVPPRVGVDVSWDPAWLSDRAPGGGSGGAVADGPRPGGRLDAEGAGGRAVQPRLTLPIRVGGVVKRVLMIDAGPRDGAWPEKDAHRLRLLGEILVNALERAKMATALRESKARARALSEATFEAIFFSESGVFIDVNHTAGEMFGYQRDELIGLFGTDVIAPESRELVTKRAISEYDKPYQAMGRRKDGSEFPIELRGKRIDYKDRKIRVTVVRDIERREKAETALRQSEKKYRKIFESFADVYFQTTLEGEIVEASPSAKSFSGYTAEELIGQNAQILYRDPGDREGFLNALRKNGNLRGYELEFKKKNGELYYVSFNADFYFDAEGKPAGLKGTIRDITRRKELEEKLQRSNKMESIGLMAGGVAHDLNNILSGIVSYPDLLLMDTPLDSPFRKPLETIKDSGQRAADVVADLLTVARGAATGKEVYDLNAIIGDYLKSPEHEKLRRDHPGVVFETDLDSEAASIRCSTPHMKKILSDLLLNGIEAVDKLGTVAVKTGSRRLNEPLTGYEDIPAGEYVLLTVSDTGGGVSREDMGRIFEPFYTRKAMGRTGTGLGLAVVWNIVRDHGGRIDARADEGGMRFELYFPAARDESRRERETVPFEEYAGKGERVLVV
ncbi:MAG: PAS domain S-box protein, partial [Desulfobacterales bacterium]|nr:PAS domain S-box protein [Desulfobacterales bacterium]